MKTLTRTLTALVCVGLLGNLFFYREYTPLTLGLFMLLVTLFVIITAKHVHKVMVLLSAVVVACIYVVASRTSVFVQIQTILTLITVTATIWYISISEHGSFCSFTEVFMSPFYASLTYLRSFFETMRPSFFGRMYTDVVAHFGDNKQHSRGLSTILGVVIAIPVVVILVLSFASADPIYYSFLKQIIYPELLREIPWRIVLSCILVAICIPLISPKTRRIFISPSSLLSRIQLTRELSIVLAAVTLVILSFIVIQWPYVFVNVKAETDLSRFGITTYAEYVKKGFIELLRVSAFIYLILWVGLTALRQSVQKPCILHILQWILMGEFLVILVSIARRVYLYQLYHGLTLVRVYGSLFLVLLFLLTLTLAGRHLSRKIRFGQVEGILFIVFFLVIGFWNVERYIVHTNPPTVNKRVDNVYLSRLSADGVDGWIQSYNHAKHVVEKYTQQQGILDAHARQEIAYAYYILFQMTGHYQQYAIRYDSKSDFQKYVNTIVDFQIERLEKERDELIEYKAKPGEEWTKERPKEIQKTIEKLNAMKNMSKIGSQLSEKKPTENIDVLIDGNGWAMLPTFEPITSPISTSFYNTYIRTFPDDGSWYEPNIVEKYENMKFLDRVYLFNSSDVHAYEKMKKSMPLAELHKLQEKYYALYERIAKQSDRSYERDISLESPLVR